MLTLERRAMSPDGAGSSSLKSVIKQAVYTIPVLPYNQKTCAICLECLDLKDVKGVFVLAKCKHAFHDGCGYSFISNSPTQQPGTLCPVCMQYSEHYCRVSVN